ncbi:MAG: peptidoglycan-binding domain-containing protein, partial [Pseudomonadota bacterium]
MKAHGEADRLILTQQVLDLVRNPGKIDRGSKEFETSRADLPDRPDGLTVGDRGSEVKDIQAALNLLGYSAGAEDGVFGQNTERAVVNFQRENGLDVTGAVNEETMKALDEALNDTRDSLPPSRMEGNANDAAKAGTKQINQSRQVGNTGAAVGGAGAAGAAAEGGIVEEVIERVIPDEEDDDTPPQDDEPADTSGQGEASSQEPPSEEQPTTDETDVEPEP